MMGPKHSIGRLMLMHPSADVGCMELELAVVQKG
jgi:hypothetical protein